MQTEFITLGTETPLSWFHFRHDDLGGVVVSLPLSRHVPLVSSIRPSGGSRVCVDTGEQGYVYP